MHRNTKRAVLGAIALFTLTLSVYTQDNSNSPPSAAPTAAPPGGMTAVPRTIKFSGMLQDQSGKPLSGPVTVSFSLYERPSGANPLWVETRSITLDAAGRYSVLLGSESPNGLPLDLFTSGKALWLGVEPQISGVGEQPRIPLVAVPYALKAVDADTLGGKPASAYVLADSLGASSTLQAGAAAASAIAAGGSRAVKSEAEAVSQSSAPCSLVSDGNASANQVAIYSGACTASEDANFVDMNGKVGIGTSSPTATLEVNGTAQFDQPVSLAGAALPAMGTATASAGANSNPFDLFASSFNSSTSTAVAQDFRWLAEATGNNTSSPSATLNLQYAAGGGTPAETGLSIAPTGLLTFASGQTFPGTGTITGITTAAGSGILGGGTTGTLSLSVDPTVVLTQTSAAVTYLMQANAASTYLSQASAAATYLPLVGGTLTGGLSGTTANFSGALAAAGGTFGSSLSAGGGLVLPATARATASGGATSYPLDLQASSFRSSTGNADTTDFRWLAEPTGNNTSNPAAKLSLQFGEWGGTPTDTGLSIDATGVITFANNQQFPSTMIQSGATSPTYNYYGANGFWQSGIDSTSPILPNRDFFIGQSNGPFAGGTTDILYLQDNSQFSTLTSAVPKGGTTLLLASPLTMSAINQVMLGTSTGGNQEAVTVSAGSGSNVLTVSPTAYAHRANEVVTVLADLAHGATIGLGGDATDPNMRVNIFGGGSNQPGMGELNIVAGNQTNDVERIMYGSQVRYRIGPDFTHMIQTTPSNRVVTDGVLNGTTTVTSATANFTSADLGRYILGSGIPTRPATYIAQINSSTSVTISQAATTSASGVSLTIIVPYFRVQTNGEYPVFSVYGTAPVAVVMPVSAVGIGTNTEAVPSNGNLDLEMGASNATLHVGTANANFNLKVPGAGGTVTMGPLFANPLGIQTGATTRLYLDSSGNVGIGTTTPSATLEVNGAAKFDQPVTFASGQQFPGADVTGTVPQATTANGLSCTGCVGKTQLGVNYAASSTQGGAATNALLLGGVAASNYARLDIGNSFNGNQSVTGNVNVTGSFSGVSAGIGTTAPAAGLQVQNTGLSGVFQNNAKGIVDIAGNGNTAQFQTLTFSDSYAHVLGKIASYKTSRGSYLYLGTSDLYGSTIPGSGITNNGLVIDYKGNVGIGTTTPAVALEVNGTAQFDQPVTFASGQQFPGAEVTGTVPQATTANGLSCMGCVGNTQLGVNYAASSTQGGAATNALALNGLGASAFQPAGTYLTGVTSGGGLVVSGTTVALDETSTGYLKSNFLPLSGGILTGSLTGTMASFSGALAAAGGTFSNSLSAGGGLALPATATATASAGANSNPFDLLASSFNSSTSAAVAQDFRWLAEATGNNTNSPSATLNLQYAAGGGTLAETGLSIAPTGLLTFASGQTFPGTGTITGITTAAGSGILGGGTTGTLSLSVDPTVVLTQTSAAVTYLAQANAASTYLSQASAAATYLPLVGGTLTGGLSGTTANFSGALAAAGGTFSNSLSAGGGLALPATATATASGGATSNPLDLQASSFRSSTGNAGTMDFRWLAEPTGNNTSNPAAKLSLQFGEWGGTPTDTGLSIDATGAITFANNQQFPSTMIQSGGASPTYNYYGANGFWQSGIDLSSPILPNRDFFIGQSNGPFAGGVSDILYLQDNSQFSTLTSAVPQGGTTLLLASPLTMSAINQVMLGTSTGGNQEAVTVSAGSGSNVLTVSPTAYAHRANEVVTVLADLAHGATIGLGGDAPDPNMRVNIFGGGSNQPGMGELNIVAGNQTNDVERIMYGSSVQYRIGPDFTHMIQTTPSNRVVTDGVLNGTTTVTSATANFTSADLGRYILGSGIPTRPATYITQINSSTSVTISQAATTSASGVSLTIIVPYFRVQTNGEYPVFSVHGISPPAVVMPVSVVGIGTNTEAVPSNGNLDLEMGASNATFHVGTANANFDLEVPGAGGTVTMGPLFANPLGIQTGATTRLYLDSSGNVGIGTTTPSATLEVNGAAKFDGPVTFASGQQFPGADMTGTVPQATTATGLSCTGCVGNTQLGVKYAASSTQGGAATNALLLGGVAASNYARLDIGNSFNGNQNVTGNVNATGSFSGASVAIGVSSPQNPLDVNGAVNTTIADFNAPLDGMGDYAGIQLGGSTRNRQYGVFIRGVKTTSSGGYWNDALTFNVTRTDTYSTVNEAMRITSDGNVGIGTVTPSAALEVKGTIVNHGANTCALSKQNAMATCDTSLSNVQQINPVGGTNITTVTVTNLKAGYHMDLIVCQDGTGGSTVNLTVAPFHGGMTVGATASKCSAQSFVSPDGKNLYALSAGVVNQ